MRQLDELVVAITGAGRGIGAATAALLAEREARVFGCARTDDALDELAEQSTNITGAALDIRDDSAVRAWFDTIEDREGRLDVLINNAGILGPRRQLSETDYQEWRETIDINVNGTFAVTRHALGLLEQADRPLVINLSSSVGRQGRAGWGAYSVSKFGVEGLTEVAADELADSGGCVVSLNPGGTATRMRARAYPDEDPDTLPGPERIAETIELLVERLTPAQNGARYSSRSLFSAVGTDPDPGQLPRD